MRKISKVIGKGGQEVGGGMPLIASTSGLYSKKRVNPLSKAAKSKRRKRKLKNPCK